MRLWTAALVGEWLRRVHSERRTPMKTGMCLAVKGLRAVLPVLRNHARFLISSLIVLSVLAFTAGTANAQTCPRHGVSLSYQYGTGMLDHAGNKANEEVTSRLREYVPTATAADLNRPEHTLRLNYELQLRNYMFLRPYVAISITPDSVVYQTSGDGIYKDFNIGQVDVTGRTHVNVYTLGTDLLFQTGGCDPVPARLRLVGGFGLGLSGFNGGMSGSFDALITGPGDDKSMSGDFYGIMFHGSLMAGLKLDIMTHGNIMILGGYRAGIGYGKIESEIFNKDGPVPTYGPFFQVTLGYKF